MITGEIDASKFGPGNRWRLKAVYTRLVANQCFLVAAPNSSSAESTVEVRPGDAQDSMDKDLRTTTRVIDGCPSLSELCGDTTY